ncbi:MAG: OmpA family protein [Nitrospirae bacterium]|nr:OmpA family protein [Nitrospirota bacterium]
MTPIQIRFSTVFILGFWVAFAFGCVSQAKYRALETSSNQELAKLREDIAALNSQKISQEAALNLEKKRLQDEISGLKSQKTDLEGKKEVLEHDLTSLNDRLSVTEKQTAEIKAQKDEEINRLKGTYDNLVKDLKGEIEKGDIKVTQIRNRLSVNLVEKVLFNSGQAELKSKGKEVLKRVGKSLRDIKDKEIRIEGYTDNVPIGESLRDKFPSNWELSTQRATNVLRFLEEEADVEGSRLSAIGYGPFHPVASNETSQGRSENRRIEILLAPLDTQDVLKSIQ